MAFDDGHTWDYFKTHPEHKEQLEALLSDFSGKKVEVDIRSVGGIQEFEENYVDLAQMIQMDIEEEDNEDE